MLNDQQIEQAARKLCELQGIVPDAQALQMTRIWPSYLEMARDEIRAFLQVQEAVTSVASPLERIYPQQWARLEEYFRSKRGGREAVAESDTPPGPCCCGFCPME